MPIELRGPDEFAQAFERLAKHRVQAVSVVADTLFLLHRDTLTALALRHRLPALGGIREMAEAGALLSYGPSLTHNSRRAAFFVDRILKGAKPADLPVEQPTRFELVVNLRTAKALGLSIPSPVLQRADDVIA